MGRMEPMGRQEYTPLFFFIPSCTPKIVLRAKNVCGVGKPTSYRATDNPYLPSECVGRPTSHVQLTLYRATITSHWTTLYTCLAQQSVNTLDNHSLAAVLAFS